MRLHVCQLSVLAALLAGPAAADPIFFSTGNPDGLMAAAALFILAVALVLLTLMFTHFEYLTGLSLAMHMFSK